MIRKALLKITLLFFFISSSPFCRFQNLFLDPAAKSFVNFVQICVSSDTETHRILYREFPEIGGVVHTHSTWATSWAQSGRGIPCYGTTHADYLYGEVPCVRNLTKDEIEEAYETNTGILITEEFKARGLDYNATPAVLCKNHGPFTWGRNAEDAVHNAVVLEQVAKMAAYCEQINPKNMPAPQELQDKHYYRKHGANAYYGQKEE